MGFSHQTALVTGGASGIGKACVTLLAERGAAVVIADRDIVAAQALSQQLNRSGYKSTAVGGDISVAADVDSIVAHTMDAYGELQILIHSAGVGVECSFLDTSDAEWARLIDIDLTGAFYMLRAVGASWRRQAMAVLLHCHQLLVCAEVRGVRRMAQQRAD